MRRILKFYISLLICFSWFFTSSAQEGRIKGLRVGYDLSRPILFYLEPKRQAFEISLDFEPKQNFYTTVEYGQQKFDLIESGFNYSSEGYYGRIGLDYNFSKQNKLLDHYEMVFGGLRYAYANYSHRAWNLILPENYWGIQTVSEIPQNDLSAHWIEVVAGIRGELFKNFFMGWSFHGRVMIWNKKDPDMYPYLIPGYGKGDKKSQLGFNYSVYYRIPLYRTKNKLPDDKKNQPK